MVVSQKADIRMKHLEFVPLDGNRALAVMVGDGEQVDNGRRGMQNGLTKNKRLDKALEPNSLHDTEQLYGIEPPAWCVIHHYDAAR